MPTLKNEFACLTDLPSMPSLLMDALHQINGKQDLDTMVDKISLDPSMAVRILRIVNSPFYGMPREIGALREAIILLGFNRIRDILISICFSKMLTIQHTDFNYRQFWHHSIAVAECARQLSNHTGVSPDFAFTAGLLHDIGLLVIAMLFPDKFSLLINESENFGIEAEQRLLGFDHMTIGGRAAQYWNLPLEIQEAIEQHKTPIEPGSSKSLGLLVNTANLLINNAEQSDQPALEELDPIHAAIAILDISIEQTAQCANGGRQFADQLLALC